MLIEQQLRCLQHFVFMMYELCQMVKNKPIFFINLGWLDNKKLRVYTINRDWLKILGSFHCSSVFSIEKHWTVLAFYFKGLLLITFSSYFFAELVGYLIESKRKSDSPLHLVGWKILFFRSRQFHAESQLFTISVVPTVVSFAVYVSSFSSAQFFIFGDV